MYFYFFFAHNVRNKMSEHGVFRGYNGMAPHAHMQMAKPNLTHTGLHGVNTLPGVVHSAKPTAYAMPTVSKVVGVPQKNMSVERGMALERVKPSATKSTPGMIQLEMR
jgi:hypothetical protein